MSRAPYNSDRDPERLTDAYNDGWSDAHHGRGRNNWRKHPQERDFYERGYKAGMPAKASDGDRA